jgi:hypothetical protein
MKKTKDNRHFPDENIQAFVDGELSRDEQVNLMEKIVDSASSMTQLSKLITQKAMIKRWWNEHYKN